MRPVLLPALRRLWRDRETLQLGRPPGPAAVLTGVDDGVRVVLPLLDGTREAAQVVADAEAAGCAATRTADLLDLLDGAGLLADAAGRTAVPSRLTGELAALRLAHGRDAAAVLARRTSARVRVVGAGRVGAVVAGLLAASGVGAVDVDDDGRSRPEDLAVGGLRRSDVGRQRGAAARERLAADVPELRLVPGPVDLVVVAPVDGVDPAVLPALAAGSAAQLLVELRDGAGVVGPCVLPGTSACGQCLELGRCDRDPDWPVLSVQLATAVAAPAASAALAAAVAAQAAAEALTLVDGRRLPATVNGTLELVPPDWRWRRRSWSAHPACRCGAAPGRCLPARAG